MDVFKLAFETTIVGLLGFLWLGIAVDLLFPGLIAKLMPTFLQQNQTMLGVGVLLLAYFIGSAVVPISSQLVNDEHWPLPEDGIRCQVFRDQEDRLGRIEDTGFPEHHIEVAGSENCRCSYWDRFLRVENGKRTFSRQQFWSALHTADTGEQLDKKRQILTLFQLQESKVLNQGSDKTERFRQLHERIVVLRGAVFNGFTLFLICLFGCVAPLQVQPLNWKRTLFGLFLAACFLTFSIVNGLEDLKYPDIFDIPVLEGLLCVITFFGGFLVVRGVQTRPFLRKRVLVMVGFFVALAYGGWIWSEVIYDQQVISSYAVLESAAKP